MPATRNSLSVASNQSTVTAALFEPLCNFILRVAPSPVERPIKPAILTAPRLSYVYLRLDNGNAENATKAILGYSVEEDDATKEKISKYRITLSTGENDNVKTHTVEIAKSDVNKEIVIDEFDSGFTVSANDSGVKATVEAIAADDKYINSVKSASQTVSVKERLATPVISLAEEKRPVLKVNENGVPTLQLALSEAVKGANKYAILILDENNKVLANKIVDAISTESLTNVDDFKFLTANADEKKLNEGSSYKVSVIAHSTLDAYDQNAEYASSYWSEAVSVTASGSE